MRYFVLGVTEARSEDGDVLPLGGAKVRAVLTVLAARANRPVAPEALIGEVWTREPPADAPGALQALVARLRRVLGRDAVASEPGGYRLNTPRESVDLFAFEALLRAGEADLREGRARSAARALDRALGLWRGPAFADLPDREAAAARPEALRLAALRAKFEAELALGDSAAALPALREAVAAHPLDEPFHAQLIRALRAAGRAADALVAYEAARTVLADTLGADPGPELRALHAELLAPPPEEPAPPPARPQAAAPATADRPPRGNLRARLTSFVGRESDLAAIHVDVRAARLVTLTGPGGSGKTRLAQEAAEAGQDHYPDGVWLAELAPLDDPYAIPHAVLSALGRRDTLVLGPARDPLTGEPHTENTMERLVEYCADRRLLLVLDNCEHLIEAAAYVTAELLERCPGLTVLATSREPLGVPGEVVRPVEPLPPPTAYRLFAERAGSVRPPTAPRTARTPDGRGPADTPVPPAPDDDAAVRVICRRLDGLPLAIELAAARLRALTPRQIADRLDDRFRLLTGGSRTLLPRQQTLRAVVDWSWDLLDERERTTLRALSVFAGGCTLAAAEAVCGPDALDTVAQLVDKSLVVAEHDRTEGTRYRLLETIHEYAVERAHERPAELVAAGERHTAYVRDLAARIDPELRGSDQLHWFEVLETELDNVRAALHRALEDRAESDAIAIALAMGWFWWLRSYRDEACGWLERVAALGGEVPGDPDDPLYWPRNDLRMLLFFVQSDAASEDQWALPEARATAARLCVVYRQAGRPAARFPGMLWPFMIYLSGGNNSHLLAETDTVVDNCRAHGGDWELAAALMFRLHVTVDSPGGLELTDRDRDELSALDERLDDRWIKAQMHSARGEVESLRGDHPAARAEFEAAYRLGRELGAFGEGPFLLARVAELAYRDGDVEDAHRLLGEAEEEAERYAALDARTYIRYLRALILLDHGDLREARRVQELAVGRIGDGTPPPMFHVILRGLSARLIAAEGDPGAALREVAGAVRMAVEASCTEVVVGTQLDAAAEVLAALGDLRAAVRMSGAADAVRAKLPRTLPERALDDAVRARVTAALGAGESARLRTAGAELSREAAAAELAGMAELLDLAEGTEEPGERVEPG
ncbi:Predicted ATPase [Actinacidiphila yanglinensis]|uniref:Predicted ATPase n=1 Tax=Actinacidiphila yanglinensis TaxID=310779 RepID=A0A1H6ECQ4_9ACTN|nr:BTAD domain-containing putative transcriptional regulator [Actinacidiphila yanglinensis]SEG94585.1 Predicted ATPase [Actinacidiphila yanglinensis]